MYAVQIPPDEYFLTRSQVLELLGLSEGSRYSYFQRLVDRGNFPQPITRGGGRGAENLWATQDVNDWMSRNTGDRVLRIDQETYLSDAELCDRWGISHKTLMRRVKAGELPAPDYISTFQRKTRYWKESVLRNRGLLAGP